MQKHMCQQSTVETGARHVFLECPESQILPILDFKRRRWRDVCAASPISSMSDVHCVVRGVDWDPLKTKT